MGRFVALKCVLVVLCVLVTALPVVGVHGQVAVERVIIVLRPNVANPGAVAADVGRAEGGNVGHVYTAAIKGFSITLPTAVVARLAQDPRIALIDPDRPVQAAGQTVPTGVQRVGADHNGTAKIDGTDTRVNVDVAVLDTGVDAHPDLNVAGGTDCTGSGGYGDGNGHGTHIAGTIGALDNGFGVVGVAPGARIWSVKVLDSGGNGTWSNVICGIDWVTQHAGTVAVANMSLDGPGTAGSCGSNSLHQAVCNAVAAGVTFTTAAGNDSSDASGYVPGSFPEVINVGALADSDGQPGGHGPATWAGADDTLASFSNRGAAVTLEAPGVDILSTTTGGGYVKMSGTSMASAHAAGAAALYVAEHGRSDPGSVKSALVASVDGNDVVNVADGWNASTTPPPPATGVASPEASPLATTTPSPTKAPSATATASATSSPTITPSPTATASPSPTKAPTVTPSPTPSPTPTRAPSPTPSPTSAPASTSTAVTTANLNLRAAPSLSATVLRVIPAGATVAITGQNQNGFAPVSYQGTNGWASADYLDQSGSAAPTPTPTPVPTSNPGTGTGTGTATASDNLNLRAGPSTGDAVLTVIPAGGVVTLTGQNQNGYLSVSYHGTNGWAYGAYLDQSSGSTPNPTPTPTITLSPTQPPGSGSGSGTATATSNLNLRAGPSTGDDVLRVIPAGATVTLTGQSQNGYLSVTYDGTAGWASADYLDQSGNAAPTPTPAPSPSPTPSPDSGSNPPKGTVTSNLNLRSGPGTTYSVVDVMPEGATVTITGDPQNGYYPVTYQGDDGWASGDYLQISSGTAPASGTATTTNNVNLRAGPSTGDAVLTLIPAGASVTLTGQSQNGFKSATYQGTSGWVYADYLA